MVKNNNLKTSVDSQNNANTISNLRASNLKHYVNKINDIDIGLKLSTNNDLSGHHTFVIHKNLLNAFEINTEISNINTINNESIINFNTIDNNEIICNSNINISGNIDISNNNLISILNIDISNNNIYSVDQIYFDQTKLSSNGNLSGITSGLHFGNASGNIIGKLTGNIIGDVEGIIGLNTPNIIYGSDIYAFGNFKGNLSGNITGDVTGNLIGIVGTLSDPNNNITSDIIDSSDLFMEYLHFQVLRFLAILATQAVEKL